MQAQSKPQSKSTSRRGGVDPLVVNLAVPMECSEEDNADSSTSSNVAQVPNLKDRLTTHASLLVDTDMISEFSNMPSDAQDATTFDASLDQTFDFDSDATNQSFVRGGINLKHNNRTREASSPSSVGGVSTSSTLSRTVKKIRNTLGRSEVSRAAAAAAAAAAAGDMRPKSDQTQQGGRIKSKDSRGEHRHRSWWMPSRLNASTTQTEPLAPGVAGAGTGAGAAATTGIASSVGQVETSETSTATSPRVNKAASLDPQHTHSGDLLGSISFASEPPTGTW